MKIKIKRPTATNTEKKKKKMGKEKKNIARRKMKYKSRPDFILRNQHGILLPGE